MAGREQECPRCETLGGSEVEVAEDQTRARPATVLRAVESVTQRTGPCGRLHRGGKAIGKRDVGAADRKRRNRGTGTGDRTGRFFSGLPLRPPQQGRSGTAGAGAGSGGPSKSSPGLSFAGFCGRFSASSPSCPPSICSYGVHTGLTKSEGWSGPPNSKKAEATGPPRAPSCHCCGGHQRRVGAPGAGLSAAPRGAWGWVVYRALPGRPGHEARGLALDWGSVMKSYAMRLWMAAAWNGHCLFCQTLESHSRMCTHWGGRQIGFPKSASKTLFVIQR